MYEVPKLTDFSPAALDNAARDLLSALESEATKISNDADWKLFRDRWMARKNGVLTQVNEWLKAAPGPAKREVGQRVNELKSKVEAAVNSAQERLKIGASSARVTSECLDITLPGIRRPQGVEHPVIRT